MRKTLQHRFWERVNKTKTCWLWTGAVNDDGYGEISAGKKYGRKGKGMVLAHRLSWMLHKGKIPQGKCVLHTCDVRRCVRPKHLWIGTRIDNNNDRTKKGRVKVGQGERHGLAKMTAKTVKAMRLERKNKGTTYAVLGPKFGVDRSNAISICNRKTWKHVL